jgi:hypothetical protein
MLKLDFYRLFRSPVFYIMLGISAIIPAMLVAMGGTAAPGSEGPAFVITNVPSSLSQPQDPVHRCISTAAYI